MEETEEKKDRFMITKNKRNLKKFFGVHKFKKSTEKMMREIDRDLYNG